MDPMIAEKVCNIREKVADLIGPSRYRTWFGDATQFHLDGESLEVTVPNPFVGNWISSNFMPHLVEAARSVVGTDPRVRVQVMSTWDPTQDAATITEPPISAATTTEPVPPPAQLSERRRDLRPVLRGELGTFVVGKSNELAYSVASAVVQQPGSSFKHVVMHGGCGLGKTHLLQAICNGASRNHPTLEWQYLSGEEFTNEYIYAVKFGRVDRFRARFRNVDLLVIDDIHFLANKKATQEEFLHTFNAIDASGKVVVLSTDQHPRTIVELSEPLRNRLIAAMVVSIDPPDFDTRRQILQRRALSMACELSDSVLDFLAHQITRNVRELEGALYKLVAYASLTRDPVSLDLAHKVVEDYIAGTRSPDTNTIQASVAKYFGVSREALHSTSRDRTITQARGFAMYLVRKQTRLSFPEIGRLMGNKQHSTVLMATRRIENLINRDGAVTWKTPFGMRDVPAKTVLEELEQNLARGQDAS